MNRSAGLFRCSSDAPLSGEASRAVSWPFASQPAIQPGLREPEPPPVDLRNARDWHRRLKRWKRAAGDRQRRAGAGPSRRHRPHEERKVAQARLAGLVRMFLDSAYCLLRR